MTLKTIKELEKLHVDNRISEERMKAAGISVGKDGYIKQENVIPAFDCMTCGKHVDEVRFTTPLNGWATMMCVLAGGECADCRKSHYPPKEKPPTGYVEDYAEGVGLSCLKCDRVMYVDEEYSNSDSYRCYRCGRTAHRDSNGEILSQDIPEGEVSEHA